MSMVPHPAASTLLASPQTAAGASGAPTSVKALPRGFLTALLAALPAEGRTGAAASPAMSAPFGTARARGATMNPPPANEMGTATEPVPSSLATATHRPRRASTNTIPEQTAPPDSYVATGVSDQTAGASGPQAVGSGPDAVGVASQSAAAAAFPQQLVPAIPPAGNPAPGPTTAAPDTVTSSLPMASSSPVDGMAWPQRAAETSPQGGESGLAMAASPGAAQAAPIATEPPGATIAEHGPGAAGIPRASHAAASASAPAPQAAESAPDLPAGPSPAPANDAGQAGPGHARDTATDVKAQRRGSETQQPIAPPMAPVQGSVAQPETAAPQPRNQAPRTLATQGAIAIDTRGNDPAGGIDAGGIGATPTVTSNSAAASPPLAHPVASASSSPLALSPPALSPAAQAMPALIALGGTRSSQSIKLTLDPGTLGKLDIRIERSADAVTVLLTAEKPETAALLARDQSELHKALDQAGMPADGRSITFHVAAADGAHGGTTQSDQPVAASHADARGPASTGGQSGDSGFSGQTATRRDGRQGAAGQSAGQSDMPAQAIAALASASASAIDITA